MGVTIKGGKHMKLFEKIYTRIVTILLAASVVLIPITFIFGLIKLIMIMFM